MIAITRFRWAFAIAVMLGAAVPPCVSGSVLQTQEFAAVKAESAPPADAVLTGPVWQNALQATGFTNFTTHAPARMLTMAYLLYDDKNLYVGFVCDQQDVPLTATQTVNDVGAGLDDAVTIAIDTSGSNARTYTFSVTPRGVRYESSSESSRYNPPWQAVAAKSDGGYRVMMTIPMADMRVQSAAVQSWRIDFSRRVAATGDLYTWAYDPASNAYCSSHTVSSASYCDSTRWPAITGLRIAGATARPKPYADIYGLGSTGTQRSVFETTSGNFTTQNPRSVGLDVTVPFTSSLAFVGTLGPDFSNVEADQTTIAPQEFARRFQEYRPFFALGSQYINALPQVNINGPSDAIFNSPSIGIFDSGFKIEGTTGRNAIGLLNVHGTGFNDQVFGYSNARPDGSLTFQMAGVHANHDGITDDTIGVAGTYRNLKSGMQPVFLLEQESGTLVSETPLARSVILGGIEQHGSILAAVLWRDIGPEFSPVDGFTRIDDIRGPQVLVSYNTVGSAASRVKSYGFNVVGDRFLDRSGAVHEADADFGLSVLFKNLLSFSATASTGELRSYTRAFPVYSVPQTNVFNQTSFSLGYKDGTPSPTDASYAYGPFAIACPGVQPQPLLCNATAAGAFVPAFVQQLDFATARTFGHGYGVSAEFGGTLERTKGQPEDSEWLRRLSLTRAFGDEGQLAIGLRSINGTGGFAQPGTNIAISYHQRLRNSSQLYFEYGTPATTATLRRVIVKYVFHLGGGAGT